MKNKKLDIEKIISDAHAVSISRGWRETEDMNRTCMLIISELAECIQADRKELKAGRQMFNLAVKGFRNPEASAVVFLEAFEAHIKDSIEDELADIVIRICSFMGEMGLSEGEGEGSLEGVTLGAFLRNLPDGGRNLNVPDAMFEITGVVYAAFCSHTWRDLTFVLRFLDEWARMRDIPLDWHIRMKCRYNSLRNYQTRY